MFVVVVVVKQRLTLFFQLQLIYSGRKSSSSPNCSSIDLDDLELEKEKLKKVREVIVIDF